TPGFASQLITCDPGLAHSGSCFVNLGGTAEGDDIAVYQEGIVIPATGAASLSFYLWAQNEFLPIVDVKIDGTTVFELPAAVSPYTEGYALATADVSAFADGAAHTLSFETWAPGGYGLVAYIDDVCLTADVAGLAVLTPNGGEQWAVGTFQDITWASYGQPGTEVRVGLHKDATFIDWLVRRTDNDGSWTWVVPDDLAPDDDYHIRVQSYTDADINDYSDGYFSITPLGVTRPDGGENWEMGSVQEIRWGSHDATVGPEVRIGLHKGTTFLDWIIRQTGNDGSYYWKIPTDLEAGYGYRVRVQSYDDADIKDLSDVPFTLSEAPLVVTFPDLHDELVLGATYPVAWTCNDLGAVGPDVRIGLHKGGAFVDWMIRKTDNDGTWNWTVPTGLSAAPSYRLRLQSYTDKDLRTMSPAFTVGPPVK
ncbi:MAG TPA: Ser-Thr-rich GPI-anchored membrane family protein, partial [Candidatus Hydrogenedentes bacterium]|nr:Ser-Thr-rich GPI-anchored membrane family protein [Candidatus Hydrogenedentota bacterium]